MDPVPPPEAFAFLFTDIEGSTRLWERSPALMAPAVARHNALSRSTVESHRGTVVKLTGDGVYAAFGDPLDAVHAALALQLAFSSGGDGVDFRVRCGVHLGMAERVVGDFFGTAVNRAARIMSAAHGGQALVSDAVASAVCGRLPDEIALRDLGTVRLRDLAEPERVHQIVHADLRQRFPPLRSLEATPNNLPQQWTSFIGRERECADIAALWPSARLITIVGAGGLGKTRLALHVAADAIERFPDGAWLVELAPLADAVVAQAVATALGVKEEPGTPLAETVASFVAKRRLLIVLDNCEHLAQACADVAKRLLQAGPQVTILATSREPLRLPGETTYAVRPLATPDPGLASTDAAPAHGEAVTMFVERAKSASPAFRATPDNLPAVARICAQLDGIPLAIELAAARTRVMSVEMLAERLGDRFKLLTGGDRTALARQQTLRASIDWSYDLLVDGERTLLRRLAVFAGGWSLEAAESVGGFGAIDPGDVLDLATRLVEKSLVSIDLATERYRMLETVREYALERLDAAGERNEARRRHAAWLLALAERAEPELLGGDDPGPWLKRLDAERPNLLAAHAWCAEAPDGGETGLRLAYALRNYWLDSGPLALGRELALGALRHPGAKSPTLARCRTLAGLGNLEYNLGHYAEADQPLRESLAIARAIGDREREATALTLLGHVAVAHDPDAAHAHYAASLEIARALGNQRRIANVLNGLAILHQSRGAYDVAKPLFEEVLKLDRERRDPDGVALTLSSLAQLAVQRGAPEEARPMLFEALSLTEGAGLRRTEINILFSAIALAASEGDAERAARLFGWTEARREETGYHREPGDDEFVNPYVDAATTALGEARFRAAMAAGRAQRHEHCIAETREWLGMAPGA